MYSNNTFQFIFALPCSSKYFAVMLKCTLTIHFSSSFGLPCSSNYFAVMLWRTLTMHHSSSFGLWCSSKYFAAMLKCTPTIHFSSCFSLPCSCCIMLHQHILTMHHSSCLSLPCSSNYFYFAVMLQHAFTMHHSSSSGSSAPPSIFAAILQLSLTIHHSSSCNTLSILSVSTVHALECNAPSNILLQYSRFQFSWRSGVKMIWCKIHLPCRFSAPYYSVQWNASGVTFPFVIWCTVLKCTKLCTLFLFTVHNASVVTSLLAIQYTIHQIQRTKLCHYLYSLYTMHLV